MTTQPPVNSLAQAAQQRAEALYRSHQLLCSEAVLVSINEIFDGGLSEEQAVRLASGMACGLGDSGCLCGAVGGGVLALGLILGQNKAYARRKLCRKAACELHETFKLANKSTCCRVLSKKVKDTPKVHFAQCANLTGQAAAMAVQIILHHRPELARTKATHKTDNPVAARLKALCNQFLR